MSQQIPGIFVMDWDYYRIKMNNNVVQWRVVKNLDDKHTWNLE